MESALLYIVSAIPVLFLVGFINGIVEAHRACTSAKPAQKSSEESVKQSQEAKRRGGEQSKTVAPVVQRD